MAHKAFRVHFIDALRGIPDPKGDLETVVREGSGRVRCEVILDAVWLSFLRL
jgi:hypothetical protein